MFGTILKWTIVYPTVGVIGLGAAIVAFDLETGAEAIETPKVVANKPSVNVVLPQAERNEYLCREILTGWAFGDEEAKNIGRALTTAFEYKQSRIEITHTTVKEFDASTKQGNVRLCKVEYANLL